MHDVEAVLENGLSQEIVTALMTLIYGCEQEHHVLEEMSLAGPLANVIDALDDDVIDNLTSVPNDKNNPLINDEALVLELDFNCFQHLYTTDNIVQN